MCQIFKRILVRKSQAASKKDQFFRHCIAECPHGIQIKFAVNKKDPNGTYQLIGKKRWIASNSADWPPEVQEYFREASAPKPKKPKKSLIERRYEKAAKNLAKWQRRQKTANTKVKTYSKQVKHYKKKLPQAIFEHLFKQIPDIEL